MKYRSAVRQLEKRIRIEGVKPGLERIKELLKKLKNPHKKIPVIHIAGTNGKGSVTLMMTNALLACDYRVGTYLSPHFVRYNERFLLNGEEISDQEFAELYSEVSEQAKEVEGITEFEILTAIAFLYFSRAELDIVVMETGLGGRYDATNVAESILTVLTPVAFDHEKILGASLKEIAEEKVGIFKKGVPIVSAHQDQEVMEILLETAEYFENELKVVCSPIKFKLDILGEYQRDNAALVVESLRMLIKYNIYIPRRFMLNGIAHTIVPGRTDKFSDEPITIVDVAHNPHGIQNLVDTIEKEYPYHQKVYILGMLKRKDVLKAVNIIKKSASKMITVGIGSPEAYSANNIYKIALSQQVKDVEKKKNVVAAYRYARRKYKEQVIIIAGSFYLAGEFYQKFKRD